MPAARITRQWPDGSALVSEVDSDLDSVTEVVASVVALDREAAPDDEDAER